MAQLLKNKLVCEGEWLYKSRKPNSLKGFSAYWDVVKAPRTFCVVNMTEYLDDEIRSDRLWPSDG